MSAKSHILFVDDDRHLTKSMHDFLLHEGFIVTTAPTAEAALKALEKEKPDLIILDISMPGIGGIGFLKHISTDDGSLRYPVLVLTARAAMNEFFSMLAVDGFLPKPCSELDILRMIKSILAKKHRDIAQQRKILIGEDDTAAASELEKTFQHAGFKAHTVATGPEILEQAVTLAPNCILVKELFTGMNGSAISRLLKSIPKTESIPIIIYDETRDGGIPPLHKAEKFIVSARPQDLLNAVNALI